LGAQYVGLGIVLNIKAFRSLNLLVATKHNRGRNGSTGSDKNAINFGDYPIVIKYQNKPEGKKH